MGAIARGFACILVIHVGSYQVSSQNQQAIAQYVLSNYATPTSNRPAQNAPRPNIQPTLSNFAASVPSQVPSKPSLPKSPEMCNAPLDSNVLNNLAIALQLLIVSNIMNMPAIEPETLSISKYVSKPKFESSVPKYESGPLTPFAYSPVEPLISSYIEQTLSKPSMYSYETQALSKPSFYSYEPQSLAKPNLYSYEAQSLPNANFLGSAGFAEPAFGSSMGVARPNHRSSMTLMSPYDALGTSSFADSLSSSFPSSYSKNDFQSPYASILAADGARDVFSINDFF